MQAVFRLEIVLIISPGISLTCIKKMTKRRRTRGDVRRPAVVSSGVCRDADFEEIVFSPLAKSEKFFENLPCIFERGIRSNTGSLNPL